MKLLLLPLLATLGLAQPLPAVNNLTVSGISCTFTVIDSLVSVATECVQVSDGTILKRAVEVPQIKGSLLGTGPIICILSKTNASVTLQCSTDDDVNTPKIILTGTLSPVAKNRKWWIIWN